jgi:hypothetical protein
MVSSTLDDCIHLLPDNSHKSKHRIIVYRSSKDFTKVLTALPVVINESKELNAFVELKWESENYGR